MLIKFTNCRLARSGKLYNEDLWVDDITGQVVESQSTFFDKRIGPDQVLDMGGRIIAPGYIDVQINGAMGFDFSKPASEEEIVAGKNLIDKAIVHFGVTSYCPTIISQKPEIYHGVSFN